MDILMPVETEEQYDEALRRISSMEGKVPAPDTPDGQEFMALIKLVDEYEKEHHDPVQPAHPSVIVDERRKQLGLTQAELAEETNIPASRISEIINRKRLPSRRQIEKLSRFFDISADLLVRNSSEPAAAE